MTAAVHISGPSMQRTPYGGDLLDPGVALLQWPRLHILLTCHARHPGMLPGGPSRAYCSATGNGTPTPPALLGQDGAGVESEQPSNNALKLTGHCYDPEQLWSPAA